MDVENTVTETRGLYGKQLAANIHSALSGVETVYSYGQIYIHLEKNVGKKAELKGWLYALLESLPEIAHPIERIQFVVYQAGSMDLILTINPGKFDVLAVYDAIESGLNFSSPPPAAWELEPLPLNHPYYTQKGWLQKQIEAKKSHLKSKNISFEDVKDLPNVKPLMDAFASEEQLREKASLFMNAREVYDIPDGRHEEVVNEYYGYKGKKKSDPMAKKLLFVENSWKAFDAWLQYQEKFIYRSPRLDGQKQARLEPERLKEALEKLEEMGFATKTIGNNEIHFDFKGSRIIYFPYTQWASGKTINDGRGLNALLKQLSK